MLCSWKNEAMSVHARPRVFVSYSLRDDEGRSLRDILGQQFDVIAPEMLTGSVVRHTALRQSLMDVDVAVIALPTEDDPSRNNVIFEAGAAAGAGVPLVLVGEAKSAPRDLADGLVFDFDRIADVIDAVEELCRSRYATKRAEVRISDHDEAAAVERFHVDVIAQPVTLLSSEYVDEWITRVRHVRSERSAIRLISELFQSAGARTLSTEPSNEQISDRPDLVLWHDDLLATFGLPLPVEVLLKLKSWPSIQPRLERTLATSGGRTLVAVVVRDGMQPRVWTDGRRTILICFADQLARALTRMALAEALSAMLSAAAAA
jgi:predicted nucleotidyltransferase